MNLSNALLLSVAAAVAAGHPSVRGGSDGDYELRRRLVFDPPPFCGGEPPANPLYQPCCGESPCWCDLDADSSSSSDSSSGDIDTCPLFPSQGIYNFPPATFPGSSSPDIIEFFDLLTLDTGCEPPEICQPDLSTSENLDGKSISRDLPPGIPDWNSVLLPGKLPCDKVRGNKVCGIQFKYDGSPISPEYVPDCNPSIRATHYKVKTFRNKNQLNRAGYFVLHEGDCGACSTAQDLAAYMKYSFPSPDANGGLTLSQIPGICFQCVPPATLPADVVSLISTCLQTGFGSCPAPPGFSGGFTSNCATAWAVNTFFTGLPNALGGCLTECSALQENPENAYNVDTCELDDCLKCDDSVNGDLFEQLAGMTRRGAGLHTVIPRPCGSLADVTHSCVAKMMPI